MRKAAQAARGEGVKMPELPEVETVRAGLAPFVEGAHIDHVALHRANLRFPFPEKFAERLTGRTIERASRRAKYLLFELDDGQTMLSHLGMTGSYRFIERDIVEPTRYRPPQDRGKHDHIEFTLTHPVRGLLHLIYADPRRFGFVDLFSDKAANPYLEDLGPEPLGNDFNAQFLADRFAGKKAPVKAGLLDQSIIAGLGNIYVSEALHRAHILPDAACGALVTKTGKPSKRLEGARHRLAAREDSKRCSTFQQS